eukprot:14478423-Alexandrium_andersonii.AAC.2
MAMLNSSESCGSSCGPSGCTACPRRGKTFILDGDVKVGAPACPPSVASEATVEMGGHVLVHGRSNGHVSLDGAKGNQLPHGIVRD